MAREHNGPVVFAQLLQSPMLDDRTGTPSARQLQGIGIWDRSSNETLLGDGVRGRPDVSPYAAPSRASDLPGLPPAFIDVGSAETFRDEDVDDASRIWQAGGRVECTSGPVGCTTSWPHATISQDAIATRAAWLRRQINTPGDAQIPRKNGVLTTRSRASHETVGVTVIIGT